MYLCIDRGDDSCSNPHADSEAAVEILVSQQWLEHSGYKQQRCI